MKRMPQLLAPLLLLCLSGCTRHYGCGCGEPPQEATISGRVTDEAGNPLAGVTVFVSSPSDTPWTQSQTMTDSQGRYQYPVFLDGTEPYRIYNQPWDGTHAYETVFKSGLTLKDGKTYPGLDFSSKLTTPGVIDGTLTSAVQPNQTYIILLRQQLTDAGKAISLPIRSVSINEWSTSNDFHFEGLPPGDYKIEITLYDFSKNPILLQTSSNENPVTLAAGDSLKLTLAY